MSSFFFANKENAKLRAELTAAGFDVDAILKASGDQNLKAAVDKRVSDAIAANPVTVAAEATIAEGVKENGKLAAQVTDLTGKLAAANTELGTIKTQLTAATEIVGAVHAFVGSKPANAAETTTAIKKKVTSEATNIVAGNGHPGVDEIVEAAQATGGEKKKSAADSGLTGIAATEAALKARRK